MSDDHASKIGPSVPALEKPLERITKIIVGTKSMWQTGDGSKERGTFSVQILRGHPEHYEKDEGNAMVMEALEAKLKKEGINPVKWHIEDPMSAGGVMDFKDEDKEKLLPIFDAIVANGLKALASPQRQ